jgi:CheY-like chemotaxis protein
MMSRLVIERNPRGTGSRSPAYIKVGRPLKFLPENGCNIGRNAMPSSSAESSPLTNSSPLNGKRVLVVEDEYFLADDIARALKGLGARVIGPFGDLDEAVLVVDREVAIDAAIMDINLRDEMIFSLARLLRDRKVPFVFTTGYDNDSIEAEFRDIQLWCKPLDLRVVTFGLGTLIRGD